MAITASAVTQASSTLTPTLAFGYTAAAGDLLVMAVGTDAAHTGITWPGSWVELRDDAGTNFRSSIAYLIAAGGETSVAPTATGTADRWECVLWRIPAGEWHGTTAPQVGAPAATSTVNPNPPSITPSWGSETNNIFIAVCMRDDSVANTITAYPTNYSTAQLDNNATTSGCNTGGAVRIVTGSPEDPGTFTISAAETANAYTIAVRPAAAAGNVVVSPAGFSLAFTGAVPAIVRPVLVSPAGFSLAFTGAVPAVVATNNVLVLPSAFALAFTGAVPAITRTDHKTVLPGAFALTFTGAVPAVVRPVHVSPAGFALTFTGAVPAVVRPVHVSPAGFALTFTGAVPAIVRPVHVSPAGFALTFTGAVPAIVRPVLVLPAEFALTFTGAVPVIVVSGGSVVYTESNDDEIAIVLMVLSVNPRLRWRLPPVKL